MPTDKATFDADLAAYKSGVEAYITAVNAFIALPPVVDLSSEDDSVKAGLTEVQAAQAAIPGQPPPPQP